LAFFPKINLLRDVLVCHFPVAAKLIHKPPCACRKNRLTEQFAGAPQLAALVVYRLD
jgi:hypothetical protein